MEALRDPWGFSISGHGSRIRVNSRWSGKRSIDFPVANQSLTRNARMLICSAPMLPRDPFATDIEPTSTFQRRRKLTMCLSDMIYRFIADTAQQHRHLDRQSSRVSKIWKVQHQQHPLATCQPLFPHHTNTGKTAWPPRAWDAI